MEEVRTGKRDAMEEDRTGKMEEVRTGKKDAMVVVRIGMKGVMEVHTNLRDHWKVASILRRGELKRGAKVRTSADEDLW